MIMEKILDYINLYKVTNDITFINYLNKIFIINEIDEDIERKFKSAIKLELSKLELLEKIINKLDISLTSDLLQNIKELKKDLDNMYQMDTIFESQMEEYFKSLKNNKIKYNDNVIKTYTMFKEELYLYGKNNSLDEIEVLLNADNLSNEVKQIIITTTQELNNQ